MSKGISPLISVVLLIAMTVLISTVMASWLTSFQKDQQDTIANKSGQIVDCTSADITIDDVYIDFKSNITRIIVRNSGQVRELAIESALFLNNLGHAALNATNETIYPVTNFGLGSIKTLEFNFSTINMTACANFSKVIVATNCAATTATFTGTPKCIS